MNRIHLTALAVFFTALLGACGERDDHAHEGDGGHAHEAAEADYERGPHGGRMLRDGSFALELAIFETGVPPEYRAWPSVDGKPLSPGSVELEVRLTRLGDRIDQIAFAPRDDFLRGDTVVYEPHSFAVAVDATFRGQSYSWQFDSFEGRTRIDDEIAAAFGLEMEVAGPGTIAETLPVYGRLHPAADRIGEVRARFDGPIRSVHVRAGDPVRAGDLLARIESNESLNVYDVLAPIAGTVTEQHAIAGEQTAGRVLFTIVDTSVVWAELALFPQQRSRVAVGMPVELRITGNDTQATGSISRIAPLASADRSVHARVVLDNPDGKLVPGSDVSARITVAEHDVPLAVRKSGLQSYRDFTVVYANIGDQYEVRMLDLGREDENLVEVLGGLEPGTRYVTGNSYLVKADIEKSGAAHDH